MRISVAGTGYVGLSLATLLAQHNQVTCVDIGPERVEMVNNRKSPIQDEYIERFFAEDLELQQGHSNALKLIQEPLNLCATLDSVAGYRDADFVLIAAPTNYNTQKNFFDTSAVEDVITKVMQYNPNAIMVIKSTIPVGYTEFIRQKIGSKILFSPQNFFVKAKSYMTIFIQVESLLVTTKQINTWRRLPTPMPNWYTRVLLKKKSPFFIWEAQRQKQ